MRIQHLIQRDSLLYLEVNNLWRETGRKRSPTRLPSARSPKFILIRVVILAKQV